MANLIQQTIIFTGICSSGNWQDQAPEGDCDCCDRGCVVEEGGIFAKMSYVLVWWFLVLPLILYLSGPSS